MISIHALRKEGDGSLPSPYPSRAGFLSTPSARRATSLLVIVNYNKTISIHALRKEGDSCCPCSFWPCINFYPRPPQGGRRESHPGKYAAVDFYPRPPQGGRPGRKLRRSRRHNISIHALRKEGDAPATSPRSGSPTFLSTPSARRATQHRRQGACSP